MKIACVLAGLMFSVAAVGFTFFKQEAAPQPQWSLQLENEMKTLDASTNGNLGVYVKKLGSSEEMNYQASRPWYLASTVKVLVAIAILQHADEGKLSLQQKIVLKSSDPVDGSGEVQFKPPGSKLTVAYLLEKMLTQSDSTATDMLIHLLGVEELNRRIHNQMGVRDFYPITTILNVRHAAYSKLYPKARQLTNRHFIALKRYKSSSAKYQAFARQLHLPVKQLQEKSIEAAFEKYYATGMNSGSLKSFGTLLEKLAAGQLLSKAHTELMLKHMTAMTTGERRIKAGLPKGVRFAQKTGTQVQRICNVGIITSANLVVTACLEKFGNYTEGERTLQRVGQALRLLTQRD